MSRARTEWNRCELVALGRSFWNIRRNGVFASRCLVNMLGPEAGRT